MSGPEEAQKQWAWIRPQPLLKHARTQEQRLHSLSVFPVASCNIFMHKLFCTHSNCRAHITIIFTGCWLFTELRNGRWRRMELMKCIHRCERQMVPPAAPSPLLIKPGAKWCRNMRRWVDSTVFQLCSGDHSIHRNETRNHHVFQAASLCPIPRSPAPEAMHSHRITLPANGPDCGLIAKPWFSLFPLTAVGT